MIFHKLSCLIKGQRGFTLIEVIVALAITSLIGLGATVAAGQVLTQGARNSDYTTASRHAMNAAYWISRDAQMSQTIEPSGASGFPLTLCRTDWDNSEYQIIYSIEDDKLRRSYSIDGDEQNQTIVAQYINSVSGNTSCAFSDRVLAFGVTATVGEDSHELSVTKVREITPRPGL